MKKIKLLIALIMCLTIGGVYATWLYADNSVDIDDENAIVAVAMSTASSDGASGTFGVEANFTISIEPLKDVDPDTTVATANHIAAIQFKNLDGTDMTMTGDDKPVITLTFTPKASAHPDVKANAVEASYYLIDSTADAHAGANMQYDADGAGTASSPEDIFTYGATSAAKQEITWGAPDPSTGVFTYTIDVTEDVIDLTEDFLLNTHAKYTLFNKAIAGNSIMVKITDGTTA